MKKVMFSAVFSLTAFIMVSFFSCSAQVPQANLKTDVDSLSYAYGVQVTQGLDQYLQSQGLDKSLMDEFYKGFMEGTKFNKNDKKAMAHFLGMEVGKQASSDMFARLNENMFGPDSTATMSLNKSQFLAGFIASAQNKKLLIKNEDIQTFVSAKSEAVQAKAYEKVKSENQAFLDKNKSEAGVQTTASGLQYKVIKEGSGVKPSAEDTVKVNYVLTDIHGKKIQSNDSIKFPVNRVIPGWTEGIQLMSQGSKYTFYIPYNLAYGERGQRPDISPYATLLFDVELVKVMPKSETAVPAAKKTTVQFTPPVIKK